MLNNKTDTKNKKTVHYVLLYSYMMFLIAVILGVILDTLLKEKIFSNDIYLNIGSLMLIVGPLIIFWAQKTSSNYKDKAKKKEVENPFGLGPYKYSRNPTHLGLFIMTLGFGLIINSLFSVMLTITAHIITKLFFVKEGEILLEKKYGQVYIDYKKKVKNWL
jgi:protein-S-isoprenylcysteine O-methyltransferase Ste14